MFECISIPKAKTHVYISTNNVNNVLITNHCIQYCLISRSDLLQNTLLTHLGGPLNSQPKYHNNKNNNISNVNNSNVNMNNSLNSSFNEQNNNNKNNNTKVKQSQSPLQQYANLLLMQR